MSEPAVSHDHPMGLNQRSNSSRNGTTVTDQAESFIHVLPQTSVHFHPTIHRYVQPQHASHSQTPRQSAMPYLVQHPVQRQARYTVHHHPNPSNTPAPMTGHPAAVGYMPPAYADPHTYQHFQHMYMNPNFNRAVRTHQHIDQDRHRMAAFMEMNRSRQARNGSSRTSPDSTPNVPRSSPQPTAMQGRYAVSSVPHPQIGIPTRVNPNMSNHAMVAGTSPYMPFAFPGYSSYISPQARFAGQQIPPPIVDGMWPNWDPRFFYQNFNDFRDTLQQRLHQYHDLDLQEENQGMSKERIRDCTTEFKFKQNEISNDQEPDDQCSICLSKYKLNERVRRLPCFHQFHVECVDIWLKKNGICPYCRFTLKNT